MKGGTYSRALEAGFNETQATFFMHLGSDTKDEAVEMMLDTQKEIKQSRKLSSRIAKKLRKIANSLEGK